MNMGTPASAPLRIMSRQAELMARWWSRIIEGTPSPETSALSSLSRRQTE